MIDLCVRVGVRVSVRVGVRVGWEAVTVSVKVNAPMCDDTPVEVGVRQQ